jgi:hypothetical protein
LEVNFREAAQLADGGLAGRQRMVAGNFPGVFPECEQGISDAIFDRSLVLIHNGAESEKNLLNEFIDHRGIESLG